MVEEESQRWLPLAWAWPGNQVCVVIGEWVRLLQGQSQTAAVARVMGPGLQVDGVNDEPSPCSPNTRSPIQGQSREPSSLSSFGVPR